MVCNPVVNFITMDQAILAIYVFAHLSKVIVGFQRHVF